MRNRKGAARSLSVSLWFGSFFILVFEDRPATNSEIEFLPKHRCQDQNLSQCYSRGS